MRTRTLALAVLASIMMVEAAGLRAAPARPLVTLSIVSTTDLHGYVFPRNGRGGIALFGGYVRNLRSARAADGGGLLLIDSGDTYQGGIESNLTEGGLVVDAYNALGYSAAVIGNHEFDFGPVDAIGARQTLGGDPRGAIKAAAARARFPFLAANLIDETTGAPVAWENVRPSVMVEIAGIKVGIIGVMTANALRATLPVNVHGLRMAPLAPTVAAEAETLRAAGAEVVLLGAHAGGGCQRFDDPADLSSCDATSEIFELARTLPAGLVDVIAAGHTHDGLAHRVGSVAIVQGYALGRAFARADVVFDPVARKVADVRLFAPRDLCERQDPATLECDAPGDATPGLPPARYEGADVAPDPVISDAMEPALQQVRALRGTSLGVYLETPLHRAGDLESPLGNLFADALRDAMEGADVAVSNNAIGGLRTDLPDGPLTFGRLYDVFPFDNRLVRLTTTADDLAKVFANAIRRGRRGGLGISGVRVRAQCADGALRVDLVRPSGEPIRGAERLIVVGMDSMVSGTMFEPATAARGITVPIDAPVVREVVEDWFRRRGGRLAAEQFIDLERRRWEYPETVPASCAAP